MLRLQNCLLPLLGAASPLPSPIHIHPQACRLLSTSNSAATMPFSLEDYLVAACDIAPAQAREVSKKAFHQLSKISHSRFISAASNPDAIIALLSDAGLSRADITAVVSANPMLLRALLCSNNPWVLTFNPTPKNFFFKPNMGCLPLRGCLKYCSPVQTTRGCLPSIPKRRFFAKLEFFNRTLLPWEYEVSTAASKIPAILGLSQKILLRKIEFLVNEVSRMEPQSLLKGSSLLSPIPEKRISGAIILRKIEFLVNEFGLFFHNYIVERLI
ncbi:unnamed protein product [Miscanthus lutarioriparius]|uniref:Uncharacterized protein n=1 Tax=Miscanthus lutarioriparius TaxID=422564 RepID=A0A811P269_9POAL|nr:unnamed protein product [Miscanthus lutarioriparius]